VRADGQRPRFRNGHRFGQFGRIGDELRQEPVDDLLAVAIFERNRLAGRDRRRALGIDMPHETLVSDEFGDEADVHVEMGAHRSKRALDTVDRSLRK
jgi:hypothetical protein